MPEHFANDTINATQGYIAHRSSEIDGYDDESMYSNPSVFSVLDEQSSGKWANTDMAIHHHQQGRTFIKCKSNDARHSKDSQQCEAREDSYQEKRSHHEEKSSARLR
eukprot:15194280-Ditylum_brightwellii.AAC.1